MIFKIDAQVEGPIGKGNLGKFEIRTFNSVALWAQVSRALN